MQQVKICNLYIQTITCCPDSLEFRLFGVKPACVAWLELNYCSCCVRPKIAAPAPCSGALLSLAGWSINQEELFWLSHPGNSQLLHVGNAESVMTRGSERLPFAPHLYWSTHNLPHSVSSSEAVQVSCPVVLKMLLSRVNNHKNTSSCAQVELPSETNLVTGVSPLLLHLLFYLLVFAAYHIS